MQPLRHTLYVVTLTALTAYSSVFVLRAGLVAMASTDRAALEALFRATDGNSWRKNSHWNTDARVFLWHGVEVNVHGRVISLVLVTNKLKGLACLLGRCVLLSTCMTESELPYSRNVYSKLQHCLSYETRPLVCGGPSVSTFFCRALDDFDSPGHSRPRHRLSQA